jgi:hypothetical protein
MNWFSKVIHGIKQKLVGKAQSMPDIEPSPPSTTQESIAKPSGVTPPVHQRKDPYFIQIGFDFGTSFSKCICRDMMTNKAWVHIPSKSQDQELPFLIPSALLLENNKISHVKDAGVHYPEKGLYNLKNVLVLAANGNTDHPLLVPYRNAVRLKAPNQLLGFLAACAVYFLAGALGEVREKIRERFSGFGSLPEDYISINLAIPVEDAQQPRVNKLYQRILWEAWGLSDQLARHPHLHLAEFQSLRKKNWENIDQFKEDCFIYPEVSANVQGFVRSRVSSPGIYLVSDTGGGTVDQSIFIFMRQDYQEHLTYLVGRVLPLGSSNIERIAAEKCGKTDCETLEHWRIKKERGEDAPELREAHSWIYNQLGRGSEGTLALAKRKLFVKEQLNDIRVIFGGGGHREYPYEKAVMQPFSGQLFRKALSPDIIGLPVPKDLDLNGHEIHWMRRLNVAYGLSFEKSELAPFTYPNELNDPKPEEIWQSRRSLPDAPTKDEC